MGLKLICQVICVAQARAICFSERRVIGSQRPDNFCWLMFFYGIEKNGLTSHSWIAATTIYNNSHPPSQPRYFQLAQLKRWGRMKRGTRRRSGWVLLSKVWRYWWEDQGGKIRSMTKDLVGLYYLAHIVSVLILSQFWWLLPVLYMVYSWWTPVEVSSKTSMHV